MVLANKAYILKECIYTIKKKGINLPWINV